MILCYENKSVNYFSEQYFPYQNLKLIEWFVYSTTNLMKKQLERVFPFNPDAYMSWTYKYVSIDPKNGCVGSK